ncbi:hypothetical protein G9G63_20170 [Paenibacillus sp. EKM202P]|uniref:gas vesicle accessory protein GvpU n=1 Tax=Paenibacillus TaxID=44249 RepID=UPI0013EC8535|nr:MULTISPECIES: gas vesicle accessory protein GvpU [Paenibacillus]KAF6561971.1 hypothetical protein G9G63_20170 [Paenibacillus sp. EKM202P]KAF6566259.1 hypothetical protein G9G64_19305 [Paenibacillus sp. EKM207P]MCV9949274.1 hypothetical protein [Paenibacillus sp. BT-177]MEE4566303.1 gas vesicle accessory protein GvpU [Paenibacillus polymyxa]
MNDEIEVSDKSATALPLDKDFTLENLVRIVNAGLIIGITLTVGGNIITGNMISGKEYMNSITETFENINEQGETLASMYRSYANTIYASEDASEWDVEFLHLKDAIILQGTTRLEVDLWRGKINAVDGYSFGYIK